MSDRNERIQELFEQARTLPEAAREAFLQRQCAGDTATLDEVRSLLGYHLPDYLEQAEHLRGRNRPGKPADPEQVGAYRLVRLLGSGGMGTVYLAEQERPVRRKVAVKLIKLGMDTEQVVARFESERQALAMMNHPAIAQVYEAGSTAQGRPFFVMEYVQGIPIAEHCDKHRLPTQQRLELFIDVCHGVQHAHQKGIIHRDIKSSNILVAVQGSKVVPKIIDFGVAKATDHRLSEATLYTELGQIVGTPEYMSPEQADLTAQDIDTRTDVYSLGVLLYELVSGALPFRPGELRKVSLEELRRRVREEDPPRPSTRFNSLGGDKEEVARRRSTAPATLARQLSGDLDWIVMRALEKDRTRRYGSASELAADVIRYLSSEPVIARPPGALYRAGKFVRRHRAGVAFAAVLVGTLVLGLAGTGMGLVRANREADRANQEAETNQQLTDYLTEMFKGLERDATQGLLKVEDLIRQGQDKIDQLDGQPRIQGRFMLAMGRIAQRLGDNDMAHQLVNASLPLLRASYGEGSGHVVDALNELGHVTTDVEERRAYYEKALPLARKVWGHDDVDVAEVLKNLGDVHLDLADVAEEQKNLAAERANLEASRRCHEEALEIRLKELGPDHVKVAISLSSMADLLAREGDLDGAIEMHRRSVAVRKKALAPDDQTLGFGHFYLAETLVDAGRYEEAIEEYEHTLSVWARSLVEDHPNLRIARFALADAQATLGLNEEARANYELVINETVDDGERAEWLEEYANFLQQIGGEEGSRAALDRAEELR